MADSRVEISGAERGTFDAIEKIGSKSEGWYDSCTGVILKDPVTGSPHWDTCASCTAQCDKVCTWSMGYYSSCKNKLLVYRGCVK